VVCPHPQIHTSEEDEFQFTAESTLSIDDARTILSLHQKKKGPLSKAELVALVTGLMENFELMESVGSISIIFRKKLEYSNEDQFFSMVNHNLTALQQLYSEQSQEVRRASIDFLGSHAQDQVLLRETRQVPIVNPGYHPVLSPTEEKLPVSKVDVHYTVRDPLCGEVTIVARVHENLATGKELVLNLKTRVPTLALANRTAAVDYVTKVVNRIHVVKTANSQPGWKLEIQQD
jgi:hypothetical protein